MQFMRTTAVMQLLKAHKLVGWMHSCQLVAAASQAAEAGTCTSCRPRAGLILLCLPQPDPVWRDAAPAHLHAARGGRRCGVRPPLRHRPHRPPPEGVPLAPPRAGRLRRQHARVGTARLHHLLPFQTTKTHELLLLYRPSPAPFACLPCWLSSLALLNKHAAVTIATNGGEG